ncbi:unnamed protein product [Allacma fusca]|uniref:Uncharacterized protein n=1 Tax=Allacma fusca TaxID=39272 RepID=A0A8J2LIT0_9HEXA|nr:unnamed protein product [Allacma fusca]
METRTDRESVLKVWRKRIQGGRKELMRRSNEVLGLSWKYLAPGGSGNWRGLGGGYLRGGRSYGTVLDVPKVFSVGMSSQGKRPGMVELSEEEEEEEGSNYAEDGARITRFNKKWLRKKTKKSQEVKVVEYKEIRDSTLDDILETFPQAAEMDRGVVKTVMANAALYGFSPTKTAKILSRYPEFLHNYDTLLPNSAKAWRQIGVPERDRVMLFHKYPPLMDLSPDAVSKCYGFLSQYFSTKELILFVKNNPRTLVEDEQVLKSKLDLLWKKYSHSTLSIAKSEAVSRNFSQIHFRHEFLIRAGFYKPMPYHKFLKFQAEEDRRRIATQREKYFHPMVIVCSNDDKFLSVCTQNTLSVDELEVFQDVLEKEEHDLELEEWLSHQEHYDKIDSRSEDDSDNEDNNAEEEESILKRDYTHERYRTNNSGEIFSSKDTVDFFF